MAQSGQPDVVGLGTTKKYYVVATPGSSYVWKINGNNPEEESTTNSVEINWTHTGVYTLTVQETTKDHCVGQVQSLQVTVVPLPTATISGNTFTCQNSASPVVTFTGADGIAPYTFTYNINGGSNKTVTTTTGNTVSVDVPTTVSGTFVYHLVGVTDSGGFTNTLTGKATININSPSYSRTMMVICPLQLPFIWNSIVCSGSGTYTKHLTNSVGCDSTAVLVLDIQDPIKTMNTVNVCESDLPFRWNGITCSTAGTYSAKFINAAGCDSVAILNLTVNSVSRSMKAASVCEGQVYEFDGFRFSSPGKYNVRLTNTNGCDSIVTLVLDWNPNTTISQVVRLVPGEVFTVNGNVYDHTGVYTDVVKNQNACDSIIITDVRYINIPNTITPNGDGQNDVFMPGYRVQIYNRNGILLFDGADGWDGKYKGKPVANDTYFYVLYLDSGTGINTRQGYLTVIK